MIRSMLIKGFKSLAEFEVNFDKFNCLIGLNGAGKTSVLQALDFASHVMKGDALEWFERRNWKPQDISSKFSSRNNVLIWVSVVDESGGEFLWRAAFNKTSMSCTREEVMDVSRGVVIFELRSGHYKIENGERVKVNFNYHGSILSTLKENVIGRILSDVKNEISNVRSLELLSPHLMRNTFRDSSDDIGSGGEKLSSFLYSVKDEAKEYLIKSLRKFYPSVVDYRVVQERAGWKRLYLVEKFAGKQVETEAKHVNDGLLRVLAILAQSASDKSFLLFDEIENGVNPEVVERLVDVLVESGQQILVTTHSPLILNYLDDDVAKRSVRFVYRSREGGTKVYPFFKIPRIESKLEYMGAGEAFADTSLSSLTAECIKDALYEKLRLADALNS